MVERAVNNMDELQSVLVLHPYPYMKAMHTELLGLVERRRGHFDEAHNFFANAADGFSACANASDQARCLRQSVEAEIDGKQDVNEASAVTLRMARQLCEQAGSIPEMNRVEAVMRTIGLRPRAGRRKRSAGLAVGGLSPREAEVVALVAAGSSNAEIAGRLFLSDRTVQDHITHSLRKLGLSGRAALASWAVKQGML